MDDRKNPIIDERRMDNLLRAIIAAEARLYVKTIVNPLTNIIEIDNENITDDDDYKQRTYLINKVDYDDIICKIYNKSEEFVGIPIWVFDVYTNKRRIDYLNKYNEEKISNTNDLDTVYVESTIVFNSKIGLRGAIAYMCMTWLYNLNNNRIQIICVKQAKDVLNLNSEYLQHEARFNQDPDDNKEYKEKLESYVWEVIDTYNLFEEEIN